MKKLQNMLQAIEMLVGAVEQNAPASEELRKMLLETKRFVAVVRRNEKLVTKWLKEHPEWKTLTVFFRSTNSNNEQEDEEDFVL